MFLAGFSVWVHLLQKFSVLGEKNFLSKARHGLRRVVLFPLIERGTDRQTQEAFEALFKNKRLGFYLQCVEGRFEIPPKIKIEIRGTKKLIHDDHEAVQRSLFDYVPDDLNEYEKSVGEAGVRHDYLNNLGKSRS